MITSRHNQRVKDAVRLRERRHRERQKQFLIEGTRELDRALSAELPLVEVFVAPELTVGSDAAALLERLSRRSVLRHDVSPEIFEKLAYGERVEGVIAVAQMTPRSLDSLSLPARPIVAVLEGVEKPGNLGAIARSADAAGVAALVVTGRGTDIYNPNAIRASLGTLFTVPIVECNAETALAWVKRLKVPILAARPDAPTRYTDADFAAGAAIVLGSEAQGLSPTWRDLAVTPIRVPMHGAADSLNVSATAAVLFYEALRQISAAADHARTR
jgi:TrmH family RNA methyltransferase